MVVLFELNVAVSVIADQMSLVAHASDQFRILLGMLSRHKKSSLDSPLLQPVQKFRRIFWMRTVIEGQGDLALLPCVVLRQRTPLLPCFCLHLRTIPFFPCADLPLHFTCLHHRRAVRLHCGLHKSAHKKKQCNCQ